MFVGDFFDPFSKIKKFMVVKRIACIDNWIFMLHRKWSFIFSFISLFCLTSFVAILKGPMICFGPSEDDVPPEFLEHWCWVFGTYVVPQHIDKLVGKTVVASGIGPDDVIKYSTQRYYSNQNFYYVAVFAFQLSSFTLIKETWKSLEGGRLGKLIGELDLVEKKTLDGRIQLVANYISTAPGFLHNFYAYRYIFCEILNAANVIIQFLTFDKLLNGEFLGYGWSAISYSLYLNNPESTPVVIDPFTKMFPKVTMCHFLRSGPSGNLVPHEALCLLPLHKTVEKIFLAWWIWLVFLGLVTLGGLIYRVVVLSSSRARYIILKMKADQGRRNNEDMKYVLDHGSYGSWFVLCMINKNVNVWVFSQLIKKSAAEMRGAGKKRK